MNRRPLLLLLLPLATACGRDLKGPLKERAEALTGARPRMACLNGTRGKVCMVERPFGFVGLNFVEADTVKELSLVRMVDRSLRDSVYNANVDSLTALYGPAHLCPGTNGDPNTSELREWQHDAEYVRIWKFAGPGITWTHALGTARCSPASGASTPPIPQVGRP